MEKFKSENGITLIALAVTVIVMIIISVGLSATMTTNIEMKNYNKFKEDIITLSEATKLYYLNNGTLPVAMDKVLTSIDVPSKDKNPNDNNKYYYIDMRLLPDAETYFGEGNKNGTFTSTDNDLYVVNEKSLTVYYLKGAVLNGERHYTSVDDYSDGGFASDYYSKTDLPIISAVSMKSDGEDSTRANLGDTVTLKFISNYTLTQNPTVVIDGQDVTSSCTWNGNICTATYKVASASDSSGNSKNGKKIEFSISNYSADSKTGTTISDVNFGKSVYFEIVPKPNFVVDGVTIPGGYYYVGGTKAKGLVISDAEADNERYKGQENVGKDLQGNRWVWVPVETPSSLYTTVTAGQALSGSTGVKTTKYTNSEIISGKTRVKPGDTSSYREPDIVTNYDNDTNAKTAGFSSLTNMAETMVSEYDEMIRSIEKYKGFYIGRYELTANGEKTGATQTNVNWYTLYKNCKTLASGTKVKTRMIWGLQWDATCNWLNNSGFNIFNSSSWGNYSTNDATGHGSKQNTGFSESWKANNIYDFAGNCYELTQEAYSTRYRACRGGLYDSNGSNTPVSYRVGGNPTNTFSFYGSRPTLYLIP